MDNKNIDLETVLNNLNDDGKIFALILLSSIFIPDIPKIIEDIANVKED